MSRDFFNFFIFLNIFLFPPLLNCCIESSKINKPKAQEKENENETNI